MPLTAINTKTGRRFVMPDDFDEARRMRESLVCPICDAPVHPVIDHLREGAYVRACFRHHGDCETAYRYHPESPDHHAGKRWVLDNAPTLYGYTDAQGAMEVRFQDVLRIADVCFTLPNGERIVHEVQLAAISTTDLEERTRDYESIGCSVIWHFGKQAETVPNKLWAIQRLGGCEIIAFDIEVVTDDRAV